MELEDRKVAVLAADMYEDLELWYPYYRMKEAGAEVVIVGPGFGPEEVKSKYGYPAVLDMRAKQVQAEELDGVVIPGGYAPDLLRRCPATLKLVRTMVQEEKVVAAICHAGWVLISAGVLRGRRATSFFSIRDDMANAGVEWVDEEVVVDGRLITSRQPDDLPAFCRAIIAALR